MNTDTENFRIDLDRTAHLEQYLSQLGDRIGFGPVRFVTSVPHFTPHSVLTRLVEILPNFFEVAGLVIEVGQDQKINVADERTMMRAMVVATYPITWDVAVAEVNPLIIGQLYYINERGRIKIHTDYTYEVADAIRSNNVPWELTFNDQTIEAHEIRSRENLSESTLRPPTVVRQGWLQRAVQWCLRQVSRVRPQR